MEGFMSMFKSNCCSSRCEDDVGGHEKVDIAAYFNQVHSGAKAYSTFHASQPQAPRAISMRKTEPEENDDSPRAIFMRKTEPEENDDLRKLTDMMNRKRVLEKKMFSEKARLEAQGQHLLTAQAKLKALEFDFGKSSLQGENLAGKKGKIEKMQQDFIELAKSISETRRHVNRLKQELDEAQMDALKLRQKCNIAGVLVARFITPR